MDKNDLQERLINFAVTVIELTSLIERSPAGSNLLHQISRSGVAPALNYAEAQDAESRRDFRHKIKIALKELRETYIGLQVIERAGLLRSESNLSGIQKENHELLAILVATLKSIDKTNPS